MHPIIIIFQIFAGIFSILGIYEFLRKVFDRYVINRSQAACKILIYKSGPDAEYSLRFLESRFALWIARSIKGISAIVCLTDMIQ